MHGDYTDVTGNLNTVMRPLHLGHQADGEEQGRTAAWWLGMNGH